MADDGGNPIVVFVPLNSARMPDGGRLLAVLREKYPVEPAPTDPDDRDGMLFFTVPDGMAFVSLMPAPVPWDDLEGPCETARWWPTAADELRGHTHHLIVSLMGGPGTPLERHVWLTKYVAVVTELTDAAGVYWGAGTVVHQPEAFRELAAVVSAEDPVAPLWVDHRLWSEDGKTARFATTGLRAFGLPEVEVDRSSWEPGELHDFCSSIVGYVLGRGAAIPDGDTIGRSAAEKVKVVYARSMWEREGEVMKLRTP
ncbi:MAG: DUF4261 domain-containing protein [Gemmataceae bacterium]|nr:DUF4261 domain-containing protein [Gemmataceae bacterium]